VGQLGLRKLVKNKSLRHSSSFTAHELGVQDASGIIPILDHFERLMT
jgi:hypothetical protein